jgi:hypothetical protein
MTDTRNPEMADVAYDHGVIQPERGRDAFHRLAAARSLKYDKRKTALQRAVEFEIVPQLVMAHREVGHIETPAEVREEQRDQQVKQFAEFILGQNPDNAGAHVQKLREQGVPLEAIYLQLIAPTARYLKQLWLDDKRDFAAITLGFWRLQQLLREFSSAFRDDAQRSAGLRALLAPAPGEAHDVGYLMFGLVLLGEFFRRDGWDAWIEPEAGSDQVSNLIRSEWFDVVEFLVGSEKRLDALAEKIKTVRHESLNRALGVIVCGPMFVEHPELVMLVGGDMPASDPREGVAQARTLISSPQKRAAGE